MEDITDSSLSCLVTRSDGAVLFRNGSTNRSEPARWHLPTLALSTDCPSEVEVLRILADLFGRPICGRCFSFPLGGATTVQGLGCFASLQVEEEKFLPVGKGGEGWSWFSLSRLGHLELGEHDSGLLQEFIRSSQVETWDAVWSDDVYGSATVRARRTWQKMQILNLLDFDVPAGGRLLDLGCGSGDLTRAIVGQLAGRVEVDACDISPVALHRAATALNTHPKVRLHRVSGPNLVFPADTFDAVVAVGVLEHVVDSESFLAQLARVMRPAARLYLIGSSVFSSVYFARLVRERLGAWPYGYQRNYTPRGLRSLVGRRLTVRKMVVRQTAFDFPVSAVVDRLAACLYRHWGRYICLCATKEGRTCSTTW